MDEKKRGKSAHGRTIKPGITEIHTSTCLNVDSQHEPIWEHSFCQFSRAGLYLGLGILIEVLYYLHLIVMKYQIVRPVKNELR